MGQGKIHIVGGQGPQGSLADAERQVSSQWNMELERRLEQMEQILGMMNVEKIGLLNVIVGMASRLEKLTGTKFLELKTPEGELIPMPENVPIPTIVGSPQALDQTNLVPGGQPPPSVEETKNVLQVQPEGNKNKVDGPSLNTLTPPELIPTEVPLGGCTCEGECTCEDCSCDGGE